MQIVFDHPSAERELDLQVHDPHAAVADLLAAVDPSLAGGASGIVIGERYVAADVALADAGLHEGARVRAATGAPPAPPDAPPLVIDVVGGLAAGGRMGFTGTASIGRDGGNRLPLGDLTVSAHHAELATAPGGGAITVTDLGSHNGTWVEGEAVLGTAPLAPGALLQMGATQLRVRAAVDGDKPFAVDPDRHVGAAGTVPFNRRPRPARPGPPGELSLPEPPAPPTTNLPLNVIAVIAPLIFGVVMVVVFDNILFGLFALLSPVMLLGGVVSSRRRGRKTARREAQRFARELRELTEALAVTCTSERARLEAMVPDPPEVLRRAATPSVTLWERRPADDDFLHLRAGIGDVPWAPPTRSGRTADPPVEVVDALDAGSVLVRAPVVVDLSGGAVLGVVGDRPAALALVRSLVLQAAVHHGPADVGVVVCAASAAAGDWDWSKWLPHTLDPGGSGRRLLAGDARASDALLRALLDAAGDEPEARSQSRLVVLDDESLTEGRRSPARTVLRGGAGPVAGIVVATAEDQLPANCTAVVEVRGVDGEAGLHLPQRGLRLETFLATGLDDATARRGAQALARFEDPEMEVAGAGLPPAVSLLPLLGLPEPIAADIAARWAAAGPDPAPVAPIGMADDGVFSIDLGLDGPHGLVAGTTGSGKSELLRSLVAGLAANLSPDHLTFVLVDFKGGSAFDECARLPHTVGLVTDLDEHLGERALRCLEAELRHREQLLRRHGATDLAEYRRITSTEPLPRLCVIIDEFATLAAELPDFVESLVSIAQRGRSLGVHLILATQRPSGAVSENIKANTNLRIALRVQDRGDSTDVIGTGDAETISRNQPGRAHLRLGPGEVVPIQTALATGVTGAGASGPVDVARFGFGPTARTVSSVAVASPDQDAPSDLVRLVDAAVAAFATSGSPAPRRPWPDPLPTDITPEELAADVGTGGAEDRPGTATVTFALADDPDAQAQYPTGWSPGEGNLLLFGIGGSGTTTALASLALALARRHPPDRLHLYVIDHGAGELAPLAGLAHTGAVIAAAERERQVRLMRHLRGEVDRRRLLPPAQRRDEPDVVVLLDGFAGFRSEFDDVVDREVTEIFARIFGDGPELGIRVVATADRAGAAPGALAALVRQKFLFRLADPHDYSAFGVSHRAVPDLPPGRAIVAETGQLIQVARPGPTLADAVAAVAGATAHPPQQTTERRPPAPVDVLPGQVDAAPLVAAADLSRRPWFVPLGLGDRDLAPAGWTLYEGEHALIAGPARSGRTTGLAVVAAVVKRSAPSVRVVAVAGPRSWLGRSPDVDLAVEPAGAAAALADAASGGPLVVLVDDADTVDDADGALTALLGGRAPDVHVVAAGRADTLRTLYSHWTKGVRSSKVGVLLRPDADLDGDLLGARLPRRTTVPLGAGRGYLVSGGDVELLQLANTRSTESPPLH